MWTISPHKIFPSHRHGDCPPEDGTVADWTYAISMGDSLWGICVRRDQYHLIAKGFRLSAESRFGTPFFKFLAMLLGVAVISVAMIWN
ncbi:hypothetical protein MLD38_017366 [Melastoma candidum]|uniref:Uncharacterized protein n=1 Tax=Melastoma candidum TaxID=119954 RepID=A0ACB9QRJ8_9MYRT|nr:hypothetical protein MLD38_017366 [Melastoma candidum]